jgi:hypothetical protein
MVLPQDVMCMIYVMYAMIIFFVMFHDLYVDEFTTGRSHMIVFINLYNLCVNFLYAM